MRLQENSLQGRTFLMQFYELRQEFGDEIPWMRPLADLKYITNPKVFKERFHAAVESTLEDTITPYSFVTNDARRDYLGGVWHFERSPERFVDGTLQAIQRDLEAEKYSYMTCLHMVDQARGAGLGSEMFYRALVTVLRDYYKVWGLVAREELLDWYQRFGAEVHNDMHKNDDGLAIITFEIGKICKA